MLPSQQCLLLEKKILEDDKLLADYGVAAGTKLTLLVKAETNAKTEAEAEGEMLAKLKAELSSPFFWRRREEGDAARAEIEGRIAKIIEKLEALPQKLQACTDAIEWIEHCTLPVVSFLHCTLPVVSFLQSSTFCLQTLVALDALLLAGEQERQKHSLGQNPVFDYIEMQWMQDVIEQMQAHESEAIYIAAIGILERYFSADA